MATCPQRSIEAPPDATAIYGRRGEKAPGAAQPPRLVVVGGPCAGVAVPLQGDQLTVGRGWDNDVVVPDISVSRRHALLRRDGAEYLLVDQGSGNGTRVNGRAVQQARLRNGDEIALGDSVIQFVEAGATALRCKGSASRAADGCSAPRASLGSRGAAYAGVAALLLGATALGLWRREQRERAAQDAAAQSAQTPALARQRFADEASLLDERGKSEDEPKVELIAALAPEAASAGPRTRASPVSRASRGAPAAGRIAEAYLAGDVAAAMEQARAARAEPGAAALLARLEQFASAWREGVESRERDRPGEAIAALERAQEADRALAGGSEGPLGREVRRSLSDLHTRRALAHTSDEEAGAAAAHLRAALVQDPGNEEARAHLGRLAARANEAYLSGYVAKDGDPDAARRAFRLVVAALPEGDETARKARRWLERLDGRPGGEEQPPP